MGLRVGRLGSQCQAVLLLQVGVSGFMLSGAGKGHQLAPFSPENHLYTSCSLGSTLRAVNNLSRVGLMCGIFQIVVSMLCVSRLSFFILSGNSTVPSSLYPSQVCCLLKLKALGIWCGQGPGLVFLRRILHVGTEGGLAKRDSHARVQRLGTWSKQARQPVSGLNCPVQVNLHLC